jgi:hypothetical protein
MLIILFVERVELLLICVAELNEHYSMLCVEWPFDTKHGISSEPWFTVIILFILFFFPSFHTHHSAGLSTLIKANEYAIIAIQSCQLIDCHIISQYDTH